LLAAYSGFKEQQLQYLVTVDV